jgi:hypothetical protein
MWPGDVFSVKSRSMAALAAMILAALIAAPIASSDTPNCVTRGEFSRIHKGDSLNRVARIFDKRGKQVSKSKYGGDKSQIRQYRACRNNSLVQVSFSKTPGTRYRMDGKYSIWGANAA